MTTKNITFALEAQNNLNKGFSGVGKQFDGLAGGLGKVEASAGKSLSALGNFGSSLSKISAPAAGLVSKLTSVAGTIAKVTALAGGAGFVALGAGLVGAATAGFDLNNSMEQAGAKLQAFTKDSAKTAEILAMVKDRAASTPFAFNEMADAAANLLPSAKGAGVELEALMEKAEILAASNPAEGLAGAGFALKEALSGDFLSLVERFNLPKSFIQDLRDQGVPNLEIVSQAMQQLGLDTDLVTGLANTASGRWSTLQDTMQGLAGTVTQPLFDAMSGSLGGLNDLLTQNQPQIQAFADVIAGKLAEGVTWLTAKITELIAAYQAGGTEGLLGALGLGGLVEMWGTVQPVLSELWTWLQTTIPAAIQTASDIWNNTLMPGFIQIKDAITAQLLPALENLFGAFEGGTGGTQGFADLWTNTLQPALAAVGVFIRDTLFPAWVQLEVFLVGALSTAINLLASYWTNILFPAISAVSTFVTGTVVPAMSTLWDWLGPKLGAGLQALSDLWTNTLQPALVTVWGFINDNIVPLMASLGRLINAVLNKALEGLAGLWKNVLLPALTRVGGFLRDTVYPVFLDIAKVVKDNVEPVLQNLGEFIFPLLQEGIEYVIQAIKDMIGYFDSMADKVNSFALPDILTPGSPPPMAYALMDIAEGARQAGVAMGQMGQATRAAAQLSKGALNTLMTGISPTDSAFADDFIDQLNIGGHLTGAANHVKRGIRDALKFGIKEFIPQMAAGGGDLTSWVTHVAKLWGNEFSTVAAYVDINAVYGDIKAKFDELWAKVRLDNLANAQSTASQFASIGQSFADMITEQVDNATQSREANDKLKEATNTLTTKLTDQQKELTKLQTELTALTTAEELDTAAIEKKQAAIAKLSDEMSKNQAEITKNQAALAAHRKELEQQAFSMFDTPNASIQSQMAAIELLQDFLASGESQLFIPADAMSQAAGITGILHTQNSAQAELNRLLAEQAEREAEILRLQEAQKNLDFLGQQLSLLKMIEDRGLDPSQILGGLTFGLDASAEDLLAATNRIVTAMVDQINTDLGIHSPSKVMAKIGQMAMKGLTGGVAGGMGMLDSVVSQVKPALAGVVGSYSGGGNIGTLNRNSHNTVTMNNVFNNARQPERAIDYMMLKAKSSRL